MNRRQMILGFVALATASAGSAMAGPTIFDQSIGEEALYDDEMFLALWRMLSPRAQQVMLVVLKTLEAEQNGVAVDLDEFPSDIIAEAEVLLGKHSGRWAPIAIGGGA